MFSALDFEDFRQPRPDMPTKMEGDLDAVVRILAGVNRDISLSSLNCGSSIMPKRFRKKAWIGLRRSAVAPDQTTLATR